mmetsp:Transcript_50901/g.69281  ORF Transcript_50901/g.69281 Transcript_50901/m.69281 type:complete len:229 (-) Transcript_50901:229-915(-)|eukprot:CAMPEP_0185775928 /NCGR_PEP_ID=MMETSP1174-20130828/83813_1 /TAXON_ID=35687 /ORGANISM="Dictyocha speculum, Strain CCMP1381" /LENGTH=228 /DNA_ID=CAMNT_0028463669 /DNA_START=84 /DNA_END=770 /DNA_ORIENTATION=-
MKEVENEPDDQRRHFIATVAGDEEHMETARDITVTFREPRTGDGVTYPRNGDLLTCHYTGTFTTRAPAHSTPEYARNTADGKHEGIVSEAKVFDCSRRKGRPLRFTLGSSEVIRGWDEGLPQLSLGDRATLHVAAVAAYGTRGYPPDVAESTQDIPPNKDLVFDVELLAINEVKSPAFLRMKEVTRLSPGERQAVEDSFLEGLNLGPAVGSGDKRKLKIKKGKKKKKK